MNFIDSYDMQWTLEHVETGETWTEQHDNISLSDFEVIYGNNIHLIKSCKLKHIDADNYFL